ncbi:transcriptional regulator, IclR family [Mesorhizobium albiziae]|uniref:Transcriptional regulator, IclR family n=1 Tax=Neomesorhizobium albiziae TaxID=335020 RepID=A0A1I3WXQ8_9HYPH|nr:IclR family transcriptional regulator [Mesorhizobium albiziae]GLS31959.1 IclR family transcriptional regulator [Mesorhizobium albiziae]SFK12183.1 transcriptional regulator, IclR family [Mesorhizobium albiziae]
MPGNESGTGTLGKAIDVLEAVASSPRPPRFTDLLQLVDQPRGTLHRQISNLIEEGLLSVRQDHSYELGVTLLKLASRAWAGNQFRTVAEPHLRRLHEQTGETVHLGVLKGVEVIYLDKVESMQAVRMHSQIGNASPVYCTGVGKAALAALTDAARDRLISAITFHRHTENTLPDVKALRVEIGEIQRTGVAFDRQEHEPGIHCIAAPIHSRDHEFVAGISTTAPAYRISIEQLAEWAPLVQGAARAIMDDMTVRLGPKS